jgi:hypothetical protein
VESVEQRTIAPVCKSLRKISRAEFVSPETRLEASVVKATYLPSALMEGVSQFPVVTCPPAEVVEQRTMSPGAADSPPDQTNRSEAAKRNMKKTRSIRTPENTLITLSFQY